MSESLLKNKGLTLSDMYRDRPNGQEELPRMPMGKAAVLRQSYRVRWYKWQVEEEEGMQHTESI